MEVGTIFIKNEQHTHFQIRVCTVHIAIGCRNVGPPRRAGRDKKTQCRIMLECCYSLLLLMLMMAIRMETDGTLKWENVIRGSLRKKFGNVVVCLWATRREDRVLYPNSLSWEAVGSAATSSEIYRVRHASGVSV
jgi:hypothetical protein